MLTTTTLRLLARYNLESNEAMNRLLEKLSPAQWEQRFGGYYPTLPSLCNHLFTSDFNWLKRAGNLRKFRFLADAWFQTDLIPPAAAFASKAEYLDKRPILDRKFVEAAGEITDADLGSTLTFKTFTGATMQRNFGGVLLYVSNHQTHHRGMISVYLDSLGVENDFSSLLHLV
jgi:uncharacterized damage-inducible protein DinB